MKMTYKNKLVNALALELFEHGGSVRGGSDTLYTLNKLTIQDLEFLYLVKTGKDGI
tara:strand:- start:8109 stop:8276 length:168 start_codon:yes stop_codon:yes gene_type:complete